MPLAYFMNSTCRVMEGRGEDREGHYYTLAKTTGDSQIEESNNKCMMVDDDEEEEEEELRWRRRAFQSNPQQQPLMRLMTMAVVAMKVFPSLKNVE